MNVDEKVLASTLGHLNRVRAILDDVACPPWTIRAFARDDSVYVQGQFKAHDGEWTTRKWSISRHATTGEIVQTALKLCLTSAEHQVRESFEWRGRAVFGPHMKIERLWDIADDEDHRE